MSIRTFIAIEIPSYIKQKIEKFTAKYREERLPIKWVNNDSLHLTVKFLGDVESERIGLINNALHEALSDVNSFSVIVGSCSVFPHRKSPRILWIGLTDRDETLQKVYEKTEEALNDLGFAPEKRAFSPHLTIGRIKGRIPAAFTERFLADNFPPMSFEVKSINVMKSTLKPSGAVYTVLQEIELG